MKKIVAGFAALFLFFSCATVTVTEPEKVFKSENKRANRLVYYFAEKSPEEEKFCAYIITNRDDIFRVEETMHDLFVNADAWLNDFCPVTIYADGQTASMAVFSLPENITEVCVLFHSVKKTSQRSETSLSYSLTPLKEKGEQYYILSSESKVTGISHDEMKIRLEKASSYGQPAGTGKKNQTGFIVAPDKVFP